MLLALVCILSEEDGGIRDSRESADDLLEPGRLRGNGVRGLLLGAGVPLAKP